MGMAFPSRLGAHRRFVRLASGTVLLAGLAGLTVRAVAGQGDATIIVRGCVERDAASKAPLYKLLEDAGGRVFRLTSPKAIDLSSQVGHTVDVTGTLAPAGPETRDPELLVKRLDLVRNACTNAGAR
jgi:hypothetical protein